MPGREFCRRLRKFYIFKYTNVQQYLNLGREAVTPDHIRASSVTPNHMRAFSQCTGTYTDGACRVSHGVMNPRSLSQMTSCEGTLHTVYRHTS